MKSGTGILLSIGGLVCGVFPVFLVGALSVQIADEYALGPSQIGLQIAAFYVTCTAASARAGRFVERVGSLAGLRWSTIMAAMSLTGIAGFSVFSWYWITAFLVLGALGNTIAQVSTTVLIADHVAIDRHGIAFGLRQGAGSIATFVGGLAVPLIAISYSWRLAFFLAGLLPLWLFGVASRFARTEISTGATPSGMRRRGTASERAKVDPVMMGLLVTIIAFGAASAGSLPSFFVSSTVSTGYAVGTAGYLLAAGSVLGLAVRLVLGWWVDRRPALRLPGLATMFIMGAFGYLFLSFGSPMWVILGGILAFGAGSGWSGLFVLVVVSTNPDTPAIAAGISQTGGYAGAALGPLFFGLVANQYGFSAAWMVMFALAVGATAAAIALVGRAARR